MDQHPVRFTAGDLIDAAPIQDRIERAQCRSTSANERNLCAWRETAREVLLNPRGGDFELEYIDGRAMPAPLDTDAIIAARRALFNIGDPRLQVRCREFSPSGSATAGTGQSPTGQTPTTGQTAGGEETRRNPFRNWVIAGTRDGAAESALKDRDFATLSWTGDRQAGTDQYEFRIAIGTGDIAGLTRRTADADQDWSYFNRGFVTYRRTASSTANSTDINLLTIGLDGAYLFHDWPGDRTVRFDTGVEFVTDDQFDSAIYRARISTRAPLGMLPGYGRYRISPLDADREIAMRWAIDIESDWFHVSDAGGNAKLVNATEFFRLGADLTAELELREIAEKGAVWSAIANYQLREGLNGDGGEAQLFSADFAYRPSRTGHYQFSLRYERGEELLTFTDIEKWTFNVGFRF